MAVSTLVAGNMSTIVIGILSSLVAYIFTTWIYNIYFHPLRHFPGPHLSAATPIPYIYAVQTGNPVKWLAAQHAKYGEVVRFTPSELSFSSAGAFKDIYGHKKAGQQTLPKLKDWYVAPPELNLPTRDITNADDGDHSRMRRIFSHAFSDRALKMQEGLFLGYVDTLIGKLRDMRTNDDKVDMVAMFNYTTFDIMADLTFGESLGMIESCGYHPWVASILSVLKIGSVIQSLRYYPLVLRSLLRMIPPSIHKKREVLDSFATNNVDKRVDLQKTDPTASSRPDIWGLVLKRDDETGLSREEMYSNAKIFMMAGTETTATTLSGAMYYLLLCPDKMEILRTEVRGAFTSEEDITIERLQGLKYLFACLEETLRMYPPVPFGLPRVVPQGGMEIDGVHVPAKAIVSAHNYATSRNPKNFTHPNDFLPERWMPSALNEANSEFATDKRHALQPFSTGPRNCLGKNLAYHELRLVLAKLVWQFDFELCEESRKWAEQKTFVLWDKPPLMVKIRSARG